MSNNNWIEACGVDDIAKEDVIRWDYNEQSIAIFRTEDDEYFATNDICTHEYAHISEGFVEGTTVECPRHAGCFDIRTGEALNPPACSKLNTYPVKIDGDRIYIQIA